MKYLLPCLFIFFAIACQQNPPAEKVEAPVLSKGAELAQAYCGSCHMVPEPKLLDKKTWEQFVLIRMGALLGIYYQGNTYYDSLLPQWIEPGPGGERVRAANIYPEKARLSVEDWEAIRDYYLEGAPQELAAAATTPIHHGLRYLKPHPLLGESIYAPYVQALALNPAKSQIMVSLYDQDVIVIDTTGKVIQKLGENEVVTDIDWEADRLSLAAMGTRYGLDNPIGTFRSGTDLKNLRGLSLDSLQRPVDAQWADLDMDGKDDLILAEFGNNLGTLSWFQNKGKNDFEQHILFPVGHLHLYQPLLL